MSQFESRVAGIPCLVEVHHFHQERGTFHHNASCPEEYHGFTECDFEILDRRGRSAPWLVRKMSPVDERRIEEEIAEHMRGEAEQAAIDAAID